MARYNPYIQLVLILLSWAILGFCITPIQIANLLFYLYLGMVVIAYFLTRSVTLIQVWLLGFVYVILAEILSPNFPMRYLDAVYLLVFSNNLVLSGYYLSELFSPPGTNPVTHTLAQRSTLYYTRSDKIRLGIVLLMLSGIYLCVLWPAASLSLFTSREEGFRSLAKLVSFYEILSVIGMVLPAIIAYVFLSSGMRKARGRAFVAALPFWIILICMGNRFPLLFSTLGFATVVGWISMYRIQLKQTLWLVIVFLAVIAVFDLMKAFRSGNFEAFSPQSESHSDNRLLSQCMAEKMSPENVVDMTHLSIDYFEHHPHTYGIQSGFLFYFWIPRSLWPNKPTMIGYWLPRKYESSYSEGHSMSFGFCGEAYADFGYFSYLLMGFLGYLLYRLEQHKRAVLTDSCYRYEMVLVSMFLPWVFFMVRSPVTSTISFIGIWVVYKVIGFLIPSKKQ